MKLAKLPDRSPVKITFAASPALAKSLTLYARYYEQVYHHAESISELMPYVVEAFLESDRGFLKFCRELDADATNTDQASTSNRRHSPPSPASD